MKNANPLPAKGSAREIATGRVVRFELGSIYKGTARVWVFPPVRFAHPDLLTVDEFTAAFEGATAGTIVEVSGP